MSTLGTDDLAVFDVDDVLIEQEDALLQPQNSMLIQSIFQKYLAPLDQKTQDRLVSTVFLQSKRGLIEPSILTLLQSLQKNQVSTIALTATRIGRIGDLYSIQDWRITDLAGLGIRFDQSFSNFPYFILDSIQSQDPSPVFKSGILFSAFYEKGAVLKAFLQKVSFHPKRVVFIDDRIENVLSVSKEMKKLGVQEVYCLHYLGASRKVVDPLIVDMQVSHLVEHGQWLSDEMCREKLYQKNHL